MNAPVQNKKALLYLLDYMFKTMGRRCTDYFLTSISTIVASYFESVRYCSISAKNRQTMK